MITPQTTMGAELEFWGLGRQAVSGMESWLKFNVGDDGSVRDTTYTAGSLAVCPQRDKTGKPILSVGMRPQSRFGLEVITEPYPYADFLSVARKLAFQTSSIPQNSRTSIHVHVDASGMTWTEIRLLLLWVRALEAPIFRMACAGQTHRGSLSYNGELNDHKFARPLSNPIGAVDNKGIQVPLINWNALKTAKNASEFIASWGRLDRYWGNGLEHYMPHRLHMINN